MYVETIRNTFTAAIWYGVDTFLFIDFHVYLFNYLNSSEVSLGRERHSTRYIYSSSQRLRSGEAYISYSSDGNIHRVSIIFLHLRD